MYTVYCTSINEELGLTIQWYPVGQKNGKYKMHRLTVHDGDDKSVISGRHRITWKDKTQIEKALIVNYNHFSTEGQ